MKLLRPDYYGKVAGPLDKVLFNTLFARMVVERHIPGTVHVDDTDKPGTFLVKHPYGMSLLFGDSRNEGFNTALKDYMIDAASRKGPRFDKEEHVPGQTSQNIRCPGQGHRILQGEFPVQ
jgi:hypothetical protein